MYSDFYFGKCHFKYSKSEIPAHSASSRLSNLKNSIKKLNRKSLGVESTWKISIILGRKIIFHNQE